MGTLHNAEKMRKAQECMITMMTVDNWLELELVRGIRDQNLQRTLLQEKDPTLKDVISIATQWQSAEDAHCWYIEPRNREKSLTLI